MKRFWRGFMQFLKTPVARNVIRCAAGICLALAIVGIAVSAFEAFTGAVMLNRILISSGINSMIKFFIMAIIPASIKSFVDSGE